MKRITLIPIGTRGDITPFVALGCQLQRAGYTVRVATHASFADLIRSFNLDFFPIGGNPALTVKELTPRMTSKNPLVATRAILEVLSQLITSTLRGVAEVIADREKPSDAIVSSYPALFTAIEAAEQRRIPLLLTSLHPVTPTEYGTHLLIPPLPSWSPSAWQRTYNRASHGIGDQVLFQMVRRAVDAARATELGWGPCKEAPIRTVHNKQLPILYPLSPTLSPPPPDWPEHTRVTGAWFLDLTPGWQPSPELLAFLNAGPPPLYVGFGSAHHQSLPIMRRFQEVLTRRRQRALLYMPELAGSRTELPENIMLLGPTPHGWLFPRTAAAIHHGGVGTTSEVLRAGVPQGIIHFSVEQAYWGRATSRLGVAPPSLAARDLSSAAVEALVVRLLADSALQSRATLTAAAVQKERGVENAAEFITSWLSPR